MAKAENTITFSTDKFHVQKIKSIYTTKQAQGERSLIAFIVLRKMAIDNLQGVFTEQQLEILLDMMSQYKGRMPNQSSHTFFIAAIEDSWSHVGKGDLNDLRDKINSLTTMDLYFFLEEFYRFFNDKKKYRFSKKKFIRLFTFNEELEEEYEELEQE